MISDTRDTRTLAFVESLAKFGIASPLLMFLPTLSLLHILFPVRHNAFLFSNDGNLGKCLSKKKICLTTAALWLSSPHWAKCMTNSYPLHSKRHAKRTALIPRRPVNWMYLDLGISQTIQGRRGCWFPGTYEQFKVHQSKVSGMPYSSSSLMGRRDICWGSGKVSMTWSDVSEE